MCTELGVRNVGRVLGLVGLISQPGNSLSIDLGLANIPVQKQCKSYI